MKKEEVIVNNLSVLTLYWLVVLCLEMIKTFWVFHLSLKESVSLRKLTKYIWISYALMFNDIGTISIRFVYMLLFLNTDNYIIPLIVNVDCKIWKIYMDKVICVVILYKWIFVQYLSKWIKFKQNIIKCSTWLWSQVGILGLVLFSRFCETSFENFFALTDETQGTYELLYD